MTQTQGKFAGLGGVQIGTPSAPNESGIYRHPAHADKLCTQPTLGVDTVTDVLLYNARIHGTRKAYGWRDIVKLHVEEKEIKKTVDGKETIEKKKWTYYELSDYQWIDYVEMMTTSLDMGKGLVQLGLKPHQIFNIYAGTAVTWQFMQHACAAISVTIATAYATLGEDGLKHSLNEPECVGIFTNDDLLSTVVKVLPFTPTVQLIVYDGTPEPSLIEKIKSLGRTVISQVELRELGRGKPSIEHLHPKTTDLSCIMYTSGTTGAPKGVMITHSMLVSALGSIRELLAHHFQPSTETFLSFLPLAHILAYIVELGLSTIGCPIGYGRVKTLTDASTKNCHGDLRALKPSIMIGVPQIWETIRKGVVTQVSNGGPVRQALFNGAMKVKIAGIPGLSALADAVVFSKVKAATGGRLRYVLSGGAALSIETQRFLDTAVVRVLQGYGLTESCGMCAILPPEVIKLGTSGIPVPSVETKLVDVPEAGYFTNASPPRGEVLIRGPSVTKGYFKRPDLDNDRTIFTEDGWFRTGDVGQWNEDGTLNIIDRVKNLVKLMSGEYIALERLESIYRTSSLVANLCIHATASSRQPIAIVFPHEQHLRSKVSTTPSTKSLDSTASIHDLCAKPAVSDLILKDLQAIAKANGMKGIEVIQGVVLTPDEWTPESGLLTAAQKVQRKAVEKAFLKEIEACYRATQGDF